MTQDARSPHKTAVWIAAMRPRTLPLAIASIILGSSLAAAWQPFSWAITLLCIVTAVLLQILSNLANDFGDSQHGADHSERQGPTRAVQSGAISSNTMLTAMAFTAGLSIVFGLLLLWVAFGTNSREYLILFIILGAFAIAAAIAYTAGVRPYGYAGLGDLSVLLFFGWVAVLGSYFLQTQRWDWPILLPATSSGLLAVAVLNVNNIRDIESDRIAGKRTIPVRIGPTQARIYHWVLLISAMVFALLYVLIVFSSIWQLLFLLVIPLLIKNGLSVSRTFDPLKLNPQLKQLSLATLLFVLLFSIGQILS
ncbi:MAG: 1,4-dihydroxy-2-naphthoate polyprenyltransferase [Candidatus Promineifilaceae bacterium]|nr:1,4-dihydroxy-2-naphthoate polyprenyltransferase [Candidatus Promineifilaceae bacterium]